MNLITPIELKRRIEQAIAQTPILVKEALEEANLEEINRQNLMQGKDSDGDDMPRYRNEEYAHFKTSINPNNRGFWDLRVTGEYHKWIDLRITPAMVFFKNPLGNEKAIWLHERLGTRHLGITENQMIQVQIENKPKIKQQLLKIINGV